MGDLSAASAGEPRLEPLIDRLLELRSAAVHDAQARLAKYRPRMRAGACTPSALNLACYLSLRKHDLRGLQTQLAAVGLSSLGRGEAHILANLDRVILALCRLAGSDRCAALRAWPEDAFYEGDRILGARADRLFGPPPSTRPVRIMVTLPTSAAFDYNLIDGLMRSGMDAARINCAHDNAAIWEAMVCMIRRAEQAHGRRCPVLMDLAGPKIRTTRIISEVPVRHIKVSRDAYGRLVEPATVWLVAETDAAEDPGAARPERNEFAIPVELSGMLAPGDVLEFDDTRGKARGLEVVERDGDGRWRALTRRGAYVAAGTELRLRRGRRRLGRYPLGAFSGRAATIRLSRDDRFVLSFAAEACRSAVHDADGRLVAPARLGCTMPEAARRLKTGHTVWIDDAHLGAVVERVDPDGAGLRVTHAGPRGFSVRADKGLNFPDTALDFPALTEKDVADLDFVCAHADMVGYSFVQSLSDVDALIHQLSLRGADELPIVAKIETRRAVSNLPAIMLGTMDRHPLGVMIARGDLATELGSVRFAEIQEELLWVCEAAHVPVIWATQVLESLARTGVTSRPEITDAAMGIRAECVMLNKGPYITEAAEVLGDILGRMQHHQYKKGARLRALHMDY